MSFDLRWLNATEKQVIAAAPADWKRTPLPRTAIITFCVAVALFFVISLSHVAWLGFVGVISVIVAVISGFSSLSTLRNRADEPKQLRLGWVAAANGFQFSQTGITSVDSMLLRAGHDLTGQQFFWNHDGDEFGSLRYSTGSGKSQSTTHWHYVAARLPAPLPHMVLDAKANDSLGSDLPEAVARDQRISLEGDFDTHFTLYAPLEYQQDALYVFTPDVMEVTVEVAKYFNIEIAADGVIFFAKPGADFSHPAVWAEADNILHLVVPKLASRAARYLDDRVNGQQASRAIDVAAATATAAHAEADQDAPAGAALAVATAAPLPVIAPQGRRLKASHRWIGVGGIVVLIVIAADLVYGIISRIVEHALFG